jgi:uncharacterized protein (TIGR03435 family)
MIAGCEACSETAEIPFDNILDRLTGSDPSATDYVLDVPARCVQCGAEIKSVNWGTFHARSMSKSTMKLHMTILFLSLAFPVVLNGQQPPEFEVATVKLSLPVDPGVPYNINLGSVNYGRVTLANVTLSECMQFAYGLVSESQISGPDWIKSRDVRFDIVAKTAAGTPREQLRLMMQSLLADRLNLTLHHEARPLPFLALLVAKNGPKLLPAKEGLETPSQLPGHLSHARMPMALLATLLSRFERQLIIDMSGLEGPFSVELQWLPDPVNVQPGDSSAPSLQTALQEQLGLRLESRKGPVDVLVVDHAEKVPADN